MTGSDLTDLVLLAVLIKGPCPAHRIPTVVRSLAPPPWTPTTEVIGEAVLRARSIGHIRGPQTEEKDAPLSITRKGRARFKTLLLSDPEAVGSPIKPAFETIQICCLDLTDDSTANTVLERASSRIRENLQHFRDNAARCPHQGAYMRTWIAMETHRLKSMNRFLSQMARERSHV